MIGAYLLGLITLPVIAGFLWGGIVAFSKGGMTHCDICGYETPSGQSSRGYRGGGIN